MNTMGKLLVVVNLLFALATGAFLAVDFAARTKWKEVADARTEELTVMKANAGAMQYTTAKLVAELKQTKTDFDEAQINHGSRLAQDKVLIEQQQKEIQKLQDATKLAILNHEQALKEAQRLAVEVKTLSDTVEKREKEITKAQALVNQYSQQYTAMEAMKNSAQGRAENLLKQLKEKEIYYQKKEMLATGGNAANIVPSVRDANFVNPPPVNVKGRIDYIDKVDRSLVQITLGSDAGILKDHTLEVYRLSPEPEYLGRLRILESHPHLAIGRVVRPAGTKTTPLQDGDLVATKLTR